MSHENEHPIHDTPAVDRGDRGIWDDPKNVQILIWVFWGCCALVFSIDFFVHRHEAFLHGELAIEQMVGFYSVYGFVACVLLVLVAKQMRRVLMRAEDYYEPVEQPGVDGSDVTTAAEDARHGG